MGGWCLEKEQDLSCKQCCMRSWKAMDLTCSYAHILSLPGIRPLRYLLQAERLSLKCKGVVFRLWSTSKIVQ
jgi:hypothetical protein